MKTINLNAEERIVLSAVINKLINHIKTHPENGTLDETDKEIIGVLNNVLKKLS